MELYWFSVPLCDSVISFIHIAESYGDTKQRNKYTKRNI